MKEKDVASENWKISIKCIKYDKYLHRWIYLRTFASKFKKGTGCMNTKIKRDERIERLVKVIGRNSLPRRELIADLGLRQESRRNFYTNYLNPARDCGLVTMQFPEVPSLPEQTYRLTAKGLEFLDELSKKEQALNRVSDEEKKGTGSALSCQKRNRLH